MSPGAWRPAQCPGSATIEPATPPQGRRYPMCGNSQLRRVSPTTPTRVRVK